VSVFGGTNMVVTVPPLQTRPDTADTPSCSARSVSTPGLDPSTMGMSPSSERSVRSVFSAISAAGPDAKTIAPLGAGTLL